MRETSPELTEGQRTKSLCGRLQPCCRVSRAVAADGCALDRGGQARIDPVPCEKEPLYGRDGLRSSRLPGRERKRRPFLPDHYGTGDGRLPRGRECLAHLTERQINQLAVAPAHDGFGAAGNQ